LLLFSRFELWHRRLGKLNIATNTVRIENSRDVPQRVAGHHCGTLAPAIANGTSGRASQVMKRRAADAGFAHTSNMRTTHLTLPGLSAEEALVRHVRVFF